MTKRTDLEEPLLVTAKMRTMIFASIKQEPCKAKKNAMTSREITIEKTRSLPDCYSCADTIVTRRI